MRDPALRRIWILIAVIALLLAAMVIVDWLQPAPD
jgi:hypothetical protein